MARSGQTSGKAEKRDAPRSGTLKAILVLTLAVLTAALGLMVWNSHQARNADELNLLRRDALLTAERFIKQADRATDRLENELRSGVGVSEIDTDYIGVDTLTSLNRAMSSRDEATRAAGELATELAANGDRIGLLPDGRFVISHVPAVGSAEVATIEASHWLPQLGSGVRLDLHAASTYSTGDLTVPAPGADVRERGAGFEFQDLQHRSAGACVDIRGAAFTMCMARSSPLLTLDVALSLILNFLLVSAPALAIIGLYNQSRRETPPAAKTANDVLSRAELAASNAGIGFWDVRPGDGTAWINDEAARLLGRQEAGELSQAEFIEAFYAANRNSVADAIDDARPSQAFSLDVASASSVGETWLQLRGSQVVDEATDVAIISGVMFDVTQVVRRREKQRTAEARLRGAIESFPCPFALWDGKKRLIFWNKAYETKFDLADVIRPGVSHETALVARSANVIAERTSSDDPNTLFLGLRGGEWIKLVERMTVSGTMISFGLDVTNDVRNEEQLTQQQKRLKTLVKELERSEGHKSELAKKYNDEKARAERSADSKSAFLANMSHELRTPLNAINGFSEILVNEMYGPLGDDRYKDYANDILTSGQHLLDMINDILDIAKIEAGKMTIDPKPIDLVDPVDAAVRMIRRKAEDKGIQVILQADDGLPLIDADHRAIRQMVLNLLSNAIKFTDAGGKITVAVQHRNEYLRVAVRDTGIGIPKEHLPRLAKPFEQVEDTRERNYEGTGLGLALTKSFAEMHGGKLTIASEPGKGTLVCFYLPVASDDSMTDRFVA